MSERRFGRIWSGVTPVIVIFDSTSGAGNDIRFDFASLALLNDGGVVVAYHDSTDPDPLFAVELEMPV